MSVSEAIQGTPIQVTLSWTKLNSQPPVVNVHPVGGAGLEEILMQNALLAQLPPSSKAAVTQLLATPLDQTFNQAWTTFQGQAQGIVAQAIQSQLPGAYNITTTLPPQGSLTASVGDLSPGMMATLPPGTIGSQLTLSFSVPGASISFTAPATNVVSEVVDALFGDPTFNVTFDGELRVDVAVPSDPTITLGVQVNFLTHNTVASAENVSAALVDAALAISNWITGQDTGVPQDQTAPIKAGQIKTMFALLSAGFTVAADLGFVGLSVQINDNPPPLTPQGSTVQFDLSHPFTSGPTVTNAFYPQGVVDLPPQIGTSAPEVNAGNTLGVTGSFFPPEQFDRLGITWVDTTPGSVCQSEVQWGVLSDGQTAPQKPFFPNPLISRQGALDGANKFIPTGLPPNTSYAFRVRDYDAFTDVFAVVATDWSDDWLPLTTWTTDQVQLTLNDVNKTVLGAATLQADGTFTTTVTVPATVPPGTYILSAMLLDQSMATAPIEVVAADQPLPPVLEVLDPGTGIATSTLVVFGGSEVTTRGSSFDPNGGTISLYLDTIDVTTSLGSPVNPDTDGSFTATLILPASIGAGLRTILAQQNTLTATATVMAELFA